MAREMKDSGVAWIGEMPNEWELHRMKSCIADRTSGAWGTDPANNEGDIVCLRIADFDYSKLRFKDTPIDELTIRNYDNKTIESLLLRKGDILIEKSGGGEKTPVGRAVVFDKEYPAVYANFMDRLKCGKNVTSDWLKYVLVTFYKNEFSKNYINQTTGIQNLDIKSMLSSERIPVPTFDEQYRITSFIDTQCAHIDAVIEQTRASIEEYKKLKQAVITQAVTKGIRPDREMKDSGIEWIGEYPEDWICEKVKYATTISRGLFNHRPRNDERYYDGEYPFIQTGDVAQATKYITSYSQTLNDLGKSVSKEFPKGTLTMTIAANVGDVAILGFDAFFPDSVVGFVPREGVSDMYLYYVFSAMKEEFVRTAIKSTQLNLNIERVKELFIPVTYDPREQKEIVDYLEKKCSAFDNLMAQKQQIINELDNYKKSLIFEYVTGKKEVPA